MRLLDVTASFIIREFAEDEIPEYAILSHTWGKEEVTLQDMQSGTAELKKGYSKILGCGRQAAADGLDYIWVDTCCIDKTSSQELSEAINSMYKWYKGAKVCYAYLGDVSLTDEPIPFNYSSTETLIPSSFGRSIWFTRGWTLQELIAPRTVIFYASNWDKIGSKTSYILKILISRTTGIDWNVLNDGVLEGICVGRRMSWASKRKTTRSEDRAYSLMGLFDVNMPLLYGEGGTKAFIRLQEEIMKGSDDHSLFAWRETVPDKSGPNRGLLANSPSSFTESRNFELHSNLNSTHPYSMTNKGLHIELALQVVDEERDVFIASLECKQGLMNGTYPGIYLKCLSVRENQYCRVKPSIMEDVNVYSDSSGKLSFIYVRQSPLIPKLRITGTDCCLRIPWKIFSFEVVEAYPPQRNKFLYFPQEFGSGRERAIFFYQHKTVPVRFGVMVMFTPAHHCLFKILRFDNHTIMLELYENHNSRRWSSCFRNETNDLIIYNSAYTKAWIIIAEVRLDDEDTSRFSLELKIDDCSKNE